MNEKFIKVIDLINREGLENCNWGIINEVCNAEEMHGDNFVAAKYVTLRPHLYVRVKIDIDANTFTQLIQIADDWLTSNDMPAEIIFFYFL